MAKATTRFVCQDCGTWHSKWGGRCEGCGEWNRLVEEQATESPRRSKMKTDQGPFFSPIEDDTADAALSMTRYLTGIAEFDRVCGGGLVPGSALLVGGDPGIGKSTLLLQVVASLSLKTACAYVSGEEAVSQVRMRSQRLGLSPKNVHLAASTNVSEILEAIAKLPETRLVIIDSIQTMTSDAIDSAPGTVSQVRTTAHELITAAKKHGFIVVLVGHVTKEGTLAGPRVLEHMVDTVLYFEGERNYDYRILRSVKNRFGATDEIGVFAMTDKGLAEVTNPSALFLANHEGEVSGTAIFAGIEGTRPILCEIQALVSPSYLGTPRRTSVGWDNGRLAMVLAVLEARCGLTFGNKDVYLNVAGGLKITEPAADLAVAAALISALKNQPVPAASVYFGEVGLAGEVRSVSHNEIRLKEAEKLGFSKAFCAASSKNKSGKKTTTSDSSNMTLHPLQYLNQLLIKN